MDAKRKVAVIGAGWAGCAAAVELASRGCCVSVFESGKIPGGRARRIEVEGRVFDSGQHILLGAYTESFRMMRKVGIDPASLFLRLPLQMRYPSGSGGISFVASALPAPFHLLFGLLRADGIDAADKLALLRFISAARWMKWEIHHDYSVADLLVQFGQTPRLFHFLWRPLCIAALNTLPEYASAQVFLSVLRDSIGKGRRASNMLIPTRDLSALFPEKALEYVQRLKGDVFYGHTVHTLRPSSSGWHVDDRYFDDVVVATTPPVAASLVGRFMDTALFDALRFEPIHTCYLGYSPDVRLSAPFFALTDDAEQGCQGQFVFDRGWVDEKESGVLAVVTSASSSFSGMSRQDIERSVALRLAAAFRQPELAEPLWTQTISDRQATFVCNPGLARPDTESGLPGLFFAGDYVKGPYPGTLESAVRNGVKAAGMLLQRAKQDRS